MQAQNRFVSAPTRQLALGATLLAALALLILYAGVLRTAPSSTTISPRVPSVHEQAPDALDRNRAFTLALSSKWNNQSPDAQERNERLAN